MAQSPPLWPINSLIRLFLFKDNFIYFRWGTMPPSISREICMNFRLDISRLCKHEFNKFRCGKTYCAITYCSFLCILSRIFRCWRRALVLFLVSLGKPQFTVTDLEHCLKHLHLTVKSKLLTEYIAQCSSFDVLLVTKLIFQVVKINGRDVILTVQRTSPNKYCFILTKRLVFQTIQSNVLCANSALMYRRLFTPVWERSVK